MRRHVLVFAILHDGRVWLVPKPSRNGKSGLWEFPSVEVKVTGSTSSRAAATIPPFSCRKLAPLITFNHNITRYQITFEAFTGYADNLGRHSRGRDGQWVSLSRLQRLPLPAAHRRIANLICPGAR